MPPTFVLMPIPRKLVPAEGRCTIPDRGWVAFPPKQAALLLPAVNSLQAGLISTCGRMLHSRAQAAEDDIAAVMLDIRATRSGRPQAYELRVTPSGITITGSDAAGVFYGVQTLIQLARQFGASVPCLTIADHPDFARRGALLDISRDKVPTMETLRGFVELLAHFKVNELQLYTEHTFAYRDHPLPWAGSSPLCPDEARELDALCRRHFVDLVPNQNSFGHLHRWFEHKRYLPLAEMPKGGDTHWGHMDTSFSLAPAEPKTVSFLAGLFDDLLPSFSSRFFNVGCDETVDLGYGRSRKLCRERGTGRVYLDFLLAIHRLVEERGRTMMFWGDIINSYPDLVRELPRDVIAMEWGYEADHPFDRNCERFAASGVPFYVCPGTSTWGSLAGRTDNCIGNLVNAAENGLANGATGYLATAWGDNGHWDPLPLAYLGFCYGGAVAWCLEANRGAHIAQALSLHAFGDRTGETGRAVYELGNAYKLVGKLHANGSWLYSMLMQKLDPRSVEGIEDRHIAAVADCVSHTRERLARAHLDGAGGALLREEIDHAADMVEHAIHRAGYLRGVRISASALDAEAIRILAGHRSVWLARNRPGGYAESAARLERLRAEYAALRKPRRARGSGGGRQG